MKRWIVRERVVFEYVWIVASKDAAGARKVCEESGDGEAIDHQPIKYATYGGKRIRIG